MRHITALQPTLPGALRQTYHCASAGHWTRESGMWPRSCQGLESLAGVGVAPWVGCSWSRWSA